MTRSSGVFVDPTGEICDRSSAGSLMAGTRVENPLTSVPVELAASFVGCEGPGTEANGWRCPQPLVAQEPCWSAVVCFVAEPRFGTVSQNGVLLCHKVAVGARSVAQG